MAKNTSDFLGKGKIRSFENEKEQVKEIKQGNARAFKSLMREYFEKLTNFAYQYVRSSHVAKDVGQDVFANIWERRDSWNPTQSLKMYLYQSVKTRP